MQLKGMEDLAAFSVKEVESSNKRNWELHHHIEAAVDWCSFCLVIVVSWSLIAL